MVGKQQATNLADATANLNPDEVLRPGDPRHVSLAEARGDDPMRQLKKLFQRVRATERLRVLFACHRGAGKSTELSFFADSLKDRFHSLFIETNSHLNPDQFGMEDLLLVIAREVEAEMRRLHTPLKESTLADVESWFATTIVTHTLGENYLGSVKAGAKGSAGIPFFGKLFAEVTALLKTESKHAREVKSELRKYPQALVDMANRLLTEAAESLPDGKRLLIVLDNMDRYKPDVIDPLLVLERERFRSLEADFIITPPVDLLFRPKSEKLDALYDVVHLPTVKLRGRNDAWSSPSGTGLERFLEVLRRRMDVERLIPESDARNRLVAATGGSVRELIQIARQATLEADGDAITLNDVDRVLQKRSAELRDFAFANAMLPALASIGAQKKISEDPKCLEALYHRLAYRYNGDTWYDVHPLLQNLPEYTRALETAKTASGSIQ